MGDSPAAAPEVRRIAGAGLREPEPPMKVAEDRWPLVISGLVFQRLTGIAVDACETGALELADDQVDELLEQHRAAMVTALTLEGHLLRLAADFDAAGVRFVVLKGTAVAHVVYPDPSMRPFGDLDLLVASEDWQRACDVLRANDFRRNLPEPRRGFDRRFGKAATHSDPSGVQVDLHRTLVLGPFGLWLDPDELLRHTDTFELGTRRLERLDRTGMLLNVALHAGLGASPPLLLPLRDVAQVGADPGVDWGRLSSWMSRWRLAPALAFAFATVERELGVELPAAAHRLAASTPTSAERRAMRAYTETRRAGGIELAAMRAIPGIRAKATYLLGLLLPSREFLRARGGGGATYLSRWRIPVGWVGRRRRRIGERAR